MLLTILFPYSGDELYRNGGESPRSYEQRAMGRIVDFDAGDFKWDT